MEVPEELVFPVLIYPEGLLEDDELLLTSFPLSVYVASPVLDGTAVLELLEFAVLEEEPLN